MYFKLQQNIDETLKNLTDSSSTIERLNPVFEKLSSRLYQVIELLPILIIVFVFMMFATYIARKIAKNRFITSKLTKNPFLQEILSQSIRVLIIIGALVLSLEMLGATSLIGAVLGAAGVFGLAISFAFRDIIENYIAGIILSIKTPFMPGDHVKFSGVTGLVVRMTTRATIIKTFDGNNISIPNSLVFKEKIENYSTIPQRRFNFTIGIDCNVDPDFGRKVGLDALKNLSGVEKKPAPFALIDEIGDSSIILNFYGWVNQDEEDFFQVRSSAIRIIKHALEDNNINLPQPGYDLNIKNTQNQTEESKNNLNKQYIKEPKQYQKNEFGGSQKQDTSKLIEIEKIESQEVEEDLLTKKQNLK